VSSSDTFLESSRFNLHLIVRRLFLFVTEISNQMLELYEQNRSKQAQPSDGNEAEGSSANVCNQRSSVKSERNPKESSSHGHHQASKQTNSKNSSLIGVSDAKNMDRGKQISDENMLGNANGNHGSNQGRSCPSEGRLDADIDSLHYGNKSLPDHQCSKSSYESHLQEDKSHPSHDNSNEMRDGIPDGNEGPSVSSSMMDAMNKIDKDKVKAALEKRRKLKSDVAVKANVIDDDDLLERELENGVELAVEDEKIKQDKEHNTCSGSMHQGDIQTADQVENGHHGTDNVPTTAADIDLPVNSKEQHSPQLPKATADDGEFPVDSKGHYSPQITEENDGTVAGRHEQNVRD
jgi:cyclin T